MASFIECSSVNISFSNLGLATVNYTVVHDSAKITTMVDGGTSITVGGVSFKGYVLNATMQEIPDLPGWFETSVSFVGLK